jgi:hypothetical protein
MDNLLHNQVAATGPMSDSIPLPHAQFCGMLLGDVRLDRVSAVGTRRDRDRLRLHGGSSFCAEAQRFDKRVADHWWLIRMVLCLGGVMFRHGVDVLDLTVWILMLAAAIAGWWVHSRPQTQEDLTHTIFPDGQ